MKTNRKGHPYIRSRVPRSAKYGGSPEGHRGGFPRIARKADFRGGFAASTMAWETSLTNRRESGKNRARSRKGISGPEDPAHKGEPSTERGFGALAVPRPVFRGLRRGRGSGRAHPAPGLAVPRPVFRGLRPRLMHLPDRPGNANLAVPRPVFRGLRPPFLSFVAETRDCDSCSAETRFQGIATWWWG